MAVLNQVGNSLTGQTGTGAFVGEDSPNIITPIIVDASGNEITKFSGYGGASAVNEVEIVNSATGVNPQILATGDDTNITLQLGGKGTGGTALVGTTTNDNVGAPYVGEVVSGQVLFASAVATTTGANTNVVAISVGAGDWDFWGSSYVANAGGGCSSIFNWISDVSATPTDPAYYNSVTLGTANIVAIGIAAPCRRFSFSTTTWVYLSIQANFGSGTVTACGNLFARRRR